MTDETMPDRTTNPDDPASGANSESGANPETENADLSDAPQDIGLGPIDGQEAIDDDTEFRHTPISPNANR